jgi:hypothetical protein
MSNIPELKKDPLIYLVLFSSTVLLLFLEINLIKSSQVIFTIHKMKIGENKQINKLNKQPNKPYIRNQKY